MRLKLITLSEEEIGRLTMEEIENLDYDPHVMTPTSETEQEDYLKMEWFIFLKKLNEGEYFGELAIEEDPNHQRQATIVCSKDCIFGTVQEDDYLMFISRIQNKVKAKLN